MKDGRKIAGRQRQSWNGRDGMHGLDKSKNEVQLM